MCSTNQDLRFMDGIHVFFIILGSLFLFWILREIFTWYWKIN